MRVIPAVDIMGGKVVRLFRGDPNRVTTYGDDPVGMALQWERDGADMLHVVDLDATLGSGSNSGVIRDVAGAVSIPVQMAGGLRTVQAAADAADAADRIVIGTMAFTDRRSLLELADRLGPDRIVVSADHADGRIVIRGWQDGTDVCMLDAVRSLHGDASITEFLITNVGRDGTLQGPDTSYLAQACSISREINVIASGGISGAHDVSSVYGAGAWGVILGRALYDRRITVRDAKYAAAEATAAAAAAAAEREEKGGA